MRTSAVLIVAAVVAAGCATFEQAPVGPAYYGAVEKAHVTDGLDADWDNTQACLVNGQERLWLGENTVAEGWHGNDDLSYRWKAAWYGDKLHFLFVISDEHVMWIPMQAQAFLNDCILLYLDPRNVRGPRVSQDAGREAVNGYELLFVPCNPPRVYLNAKDGYSTDRPQNAQFAAEWAGKIDTRAFANGYVIEVEFAIPGVHPAAGSVLGVQTAVCDDDGVGRESVMIWPGTAGEFRTSMDDYGTLGLGTAAQPAQLPHIPGR